MLDDKGMPEFDAVPNDSYEQMLRELDADEAAMELQDEPEAQLRAVAPKFSADFTNEDRGFVPF